MSKLDLLKAQVIKKAKKMVVLHATLQMCHAFAVRSTHFSLAIKGHPLPLAEVIYHDVNAHKNALSQDNADVYVVYMLQVLKDTLVLYEGNPRLDTLP